MSKPLRTRKKHEAKDYRTVVKDLAPLDAKCTELVERLYKVGQLSHHTCYARIRITEFPINFTVHSAQQYLYIKNYRHAFLM